MSKIYNQEQAMEMLLSGKRVRPAGWDGVEYLYIKDGVIKIKFKDDAVEECNATDSLWQKQWELVVEPTVKAGDMFTDGKASFVVIETGEKTYRLVDTASWKSVSYLNVYGLTSSNIKRSYGKTKV